MDGTALPRCPCRPALANRQSGHRQGRLETTGRATRLGVTVTVSLHHVNSPKVRTKIVLANLSRHDNHHFVAIANLILIVAHFSSRLSRHTDPCWTAIPACRP